ncbi:phosphoserine phosphatase SerB [Sphaceloma murrayae]|uniref:phosphoserine phosphatase n=1 Tax=Sphaceloma murrayae TaxID=2082308 RepID=A0A2K1QWV4_9PEZI|nr:phosphoserine phosphatase SerB [Sphaceloma murrayae]
MASSVILTLFSTAGPLPASTWTEKLSAIVPSLAHDLPLATTPPTQRFLDGSPATAHRVLELQLSTTDPLTLPQCTALTHTLSPLLTPLSLEPVLQPLGPLHKLHSASSSSTSSSSTSASAPPRLAVFDMDSTLIQQEVIDELARSLDLYSSVAAITEAAMRGEEPYTDFTASLLARVALLRGVGPSIWSHLRESVITFTPGARECVACLRSQGWNTAVLSGGFVDLATWVRDELGLDEAWANELEVDEEGKLTGRVREGSRVVDGERKKELMGEIGRRRGVGRDAVLAVGDGSNDLPMMGEAALGVAFCAKPKVQERAPARINGGSLVDVLYVLGWTEAEIREVMQRQGRGE